MAPACCRSPWFGPISFAAITFRSREVWRDKTINHKRHRLYWGYRCASPLCWSDTALRRACMSAFGSRAHAMTRDHGRTRFRATCPRSAGTSPQRRACARQPRPSTNSAQLADDVPASGRARTTDVVLSGGERILHRSSLAQSRTSQKNGHPRRDPHHAAAELVSADPRRCVSPPSRTAPNPGGDDSIVYRLESGYRPRRPPRQKIVRHSAKSLPGGRLPAICRLWTGRATSSTPG